MKRTLLIALLLLFVASPAFAQKGFTVLANIGVGFQHDAFYEETATGVGGLNFGAGWFLTEKCAVLGRYSGTSATFDNGGGIRQTSGVWGGTIQWWMSDKMTVEAGAGYGRWWDDFSSDGSFGLILGFHVTVLQKGPHHIRAGVEYAPVFTDGSVHNIGIVGGYQFVKK